MSDAPPPSREGYRSAPMSFEAALDRGEALFKEGRGPGEVESMLLSEGAQRSDAILVLERLEVQQGAYRRRDQAFRDIKAGAALIAFATFVTVLGVVLSAKPLLGAVAPGAWGVYKLIGGLSRL